MRGRDRAVFSDISAEDLRSDAGVKRLYREAVARGWWENDNRAVLDFWCLAEKALADDSHGTPGRLFHALVKDHATGRVTNAQEERAMARMGSAERDALVTDAGPRTGGLVVRDLLSTGGTDGGGQEPPEAQSEVNEGTDVAVFGSQAVGYQHSVMMMCFFPQKRLPEGQRRYEMKHGKAALRVVAGDLASPDGVGEFRECPVPFGSRARVILPYVNAYAVRNRSREVDLGQSLREFLRRIGMSYDGRRGREVAEQVEAIAAAHILLGQWRDNQVVTRYGRVADEVSFWLERDENQRMLWEPTMWLSQQYFDVLLERPVPVDMKHLMELTRSPRRMDLYSWLAYRTTRIAPRKQVRIKLADLKPVFGADIKSERFFRHQLRADLEAVQKVYRGFKAWVEGDILVLRKSPPPIAQEDRGLLPR